jgi:nucleotide-binding universal stress UspA family protein
VRWETPGNLKEASMTLTTRSAEELHPRSQARLRPAAVGVVVGVDGSAAAAAALRWAAVEAGRRREALRIVSAWQEAGLAERPPGAAALAEEAAMRVQDALDALLRDHGCPHRVGIVTPRGNPGEMLVHQARNAALLVLGTSSSDNPGRTATYCLQYASCPVVFVPARPGASAPRSTGLPRPPAATAPRGDRR